MNATTVSECGAIEQFTYKDTGIVITAVVSIYFSCSIGFVATFGNGLILYGIIKENAVKKPSNLLLAFLAVTDLLGGVLAMPTSIVIRIMDMSNASAPCVFLLAYRYFTAIIISVSFLVFGLLSVDVFLAVKYPMRYRTWKLAKLYKCLYALVWFMICLLVAGLALHIVRRRVAMSVLIMVFSGNLICVGWSYYQVYRSLTTNNARIADLVSAEVAEERRKKGRRNAWTIAIIIIVFFLCSLPMIVNLVITQDEQPKTFYHVSTYSGLLIFLSSALNPIIFICRKEDLKRIALKLLSRTTLDVSNASQT